MRKKFAHGCLLKSIKGAHLQVSSLEILRLTIYKFFNPPIFQFIMSSLGCAQDSDGKLLDAAQIDWYHDPNDKEPIAPALSSTSVQQQPSVTTLDTFFVQVPPAGMVAGSRRSNRTTRPSLKTTDPDNVALKLGHDASASNSWILTGILVRKLVRVNTHRSQYSWETILKDLSISFYRFLACGSSNTHEYLS